MTFINHFFENYHVYPSGKRLTLNEVNTKVHSGENQKILYN